MLIAFLTSAEIVMVISTLFRKTVNGKYKIGALLLLPVTLWLYLKEYIILQRSLLTAVIDIAMLGIAIMAAILLFKNSSSYNTLIGSNYNEDD